MHKEYYLSLMKLCEGDSPFYFVDQVIDDKIYRIFSYRLASYSDFAQSEYARECRGHMFEITNTGDFIRLAAMAPTKFFNYKENPFTMDLDFSLCDLVMDKRDGSLISSFSHNGKIYLKSKTSLHSDQARAAQAFLDRTPKLKYFIEVMESNHCTVNMEYTAPTNRIVLPYQDENLTILNIRRIDNGFVGDYISHVLMKSLCKVYDCEQYLIENTASNIENYEDFINSIPDMTEIEGFVVRIQNGETVKIKTNWYLSLHRAKDSINSDRRLFEVVVNEAHDDLRSVFPDDAYLMERINRMESKVKEIYVKIKHHVEGFYNRNSLLDRKSYAILAQQEVPRMYFALAMNLYLGKDNDYKSWMIKSWKEFGIKDDLLTET